jgi:hypothetical protein
VLSEAVLVPVLEDSFSSTKTSTRTSTIFINIKNACRFHDIWVEREHAILYVLRPGAGIRNVNVSILVPMPTMKGALIHVRIQYPSDRAGDFCRPDL